MVHKLKFSRLINLKNKTQMINQLNQHQTL